MTADTRPQPLHVRLMRNLALREEIRATCEAVGWKWDERLDCAWDAASNPELNAPRFSKGHDWTADAIALLEATGEPVDFIYTPGKHGNDWWVVQIRLEHDQDGHAHSLGSSQAPDLPTAAVRAVLRWKEGKE